MSDPTFFFKKKGGKCLLTLEKKSKDRVGFKVGLIQSFPGLANSFCLNLAFLLAGWLLAAVEPLRSFLA